MIYIYTPAWGRPMVWKDLSTAQHDVELQLAVTESEKPQWIEHADRWILAVRWRQQTAILWKAEI